MIDFRKRFSKRPDKKSLRSIFIYDRQDKFMYSKDTEGTFRVNITDKANTEKLGKLIGELILDSYKVKNPMKAIYFSGVANTGKTTLMENIIKKFEGNNQITIDRKIKSIKFDDVYPISYYNDYFVYKLRNKTPERQILNDDEFLFSEWSEYVFSEDNYEENRLEIECERLLNDENITEKKTEQIVQYLPNDIKITRFATIIGYGNGVQLVEKLKKLYIDSSDVFSNTFNDVMHLKLNVFSQINNTAGIPFYLYDYTDFESDEVIMTVDWGDGTISNLTRSDYTDNSSLASIHQYKEDGTYDVRISSDYWNSLYMMTCDSGIYGTIANNESYYNDKMKCLFYFRRSLVDIVDSLPDMAGTQYFETLKPEDLDYGTKKKNDFSYLFYNSRLMTNNTTKNVNTINMLSNDNITSVAKLLNNSFAKNFDLRFKSKNITDASDFIAKNDNYTRVIRVKANSVTEKTFKDISESIGLIIIGE